MPKSLSSVPHRRLFFLTRLCPLERSTVNGACAFTSRITPEGLVVITGCGHAGIINILTFARGEFPNEPVEAVIGGLHLFQATDEQLNWTADKLKDFKVANLIGAHCTGIEAVYRIRERLALPRESAVVGSVGSSFVLGEGIHSGPLAK